MGIQCALIWNGPGGFWTIAAHKWAPAAVVISDWSNSNCPTTDMRGTLTPSVACSHFE
jgi:hypothetical protein